MCKLIVLLCFGLFCNYSFSQTNLNGKVTAAILNEQSAPIANATVELIRSKDSAIVKTALTDNNGVAEIVNIKWDNYLLRVTSVGYKITYSNAFSVTQENRTITFSSMTMTADDNELQGVTVSGKKPFIQRLSDRIVVNVENSIIATGATALDVIERSPSITIEGDVISLRGRSGVLIMIDGKPSPMNGADLINYLRGLPSGTIDRIEIITNPSARYEAAGTSGIIDIRMKKDQRLGMNGTLNFGYGQGVYPKTNAGITFNYRNKKLNVFGNYNYSYRKDFNDLRQERFFYDEAGIVGSDVKNNYSRFYSNGNTVRLGTDFFPSQKAVIGFVATTNFNQSKSRGNHLSTNYNEQQDPSFYFKTLVNSESLPVNGLFNLNFKHSLNKGRELTADIDYALYKTKAHSSVVTNIFKANSFTDDILLGEPRGDLNLKAAKVDYVHPIKSGRWDAGLKTSYVSADNHAQFFNVVGGITSIDQTKTNRFFYKEWSNAAYISFNKEHQKFSYQIGLRSEQTKIETEQVVGHVLWDSSYLQLFPSAFFNYKVSKDQTLGLSVSRRIGRPGYGQLNPFIALQDMTAYSTGNPHLLPQFTWAYQLSYTIENFNFVFDYSKTTDPQVLVIARLLDVIPNYPLLAGADSNITIERTINLTSQTNYNLTLYAPVKIASWWNMINNVNLLYNHFTADVGRAELDKGMPSIYIRNNNIFTFKKGWTAEMNANFFSGRRSGYAVFSPQWGIAAGVQKNVLKGKGSIRFNVTDIFWTSVLRFSATYKDAYNDNGRARRETRVANFNFIYRFGNNKVQAERKRTTASEEERRRAG